MNRFFQKGSAFWDRIPHGIKLCGKHETDGRHARTSVWRLDSTTQCLIPLVGVGVVSRESLLSCLEACDSAPALSDCFPVTPAGLPVSRPQLHVWGRMPGGPLPWGHAVDSFAKLEKPPLFSCLKTCQI